MIWIYRLLLAPTVVIGLPIVALFNRKVREGFNLRMTKSKLPKFKKPPIWIHCSSGEFEYAKPVIREIKHADSEQPVVVTYFSPSFAKAIHQTPEIDYAQALPLDLPGPCASFLKKVKPAHLLIARSDFWPELLAQTRKRQIPIAVFSYTQKNPKKMNRGQRWLRAWLLNRVTEIHCVSLSDQRNVQTLGVKTPTVVSGDTRYDQVQYRLAHAKKMSPDLKPDLPALVAGSTWPEDEEKILPALASFLIENRMKLILVPHEPTPEHLTEIQKKLESLQLTWKLFSQQETWKYAHVLLVDQVGYLAELYSWGQIAFVGGSFKDRVHSVMEPLGAGLLTFVGPHHENNREAIEFQRFSAVEGENAVQVVTTMDEFSVCLQRVFNSPDKLKKISENLRKEFKERSGASFKLLQQLKTSDAAVYKKAKEPVADRR